MTLSDKEYQTGLVTQPSEELDSVDLIGSSGTSELTRSEVPIRC